MNDASKQKNSSLYSHKYELLASKVESSNAKYSYLKSEPTFKLSLSLLKLFPGILVTGFIISFIWDFDGIKLDFFSITLSLEGLLRIISVSGIIGFFTNWLAIQMLFYPRDKHPILGQGLIPAQKSKIADRLALAVDRDLVNIEHIKERLTKGGQLQIFSRKAIRFINSFVKNDEFRAELRSLLTKYIHQSLDDPEVKSKIKLKTAELIYESTENSKLEKTALRLYLFVKGKTLETFIEEALNTLPSKIEKILDPIDELVDTLPARLFKEQNRLEDILLAIIEKALDDLNIYEIVKDNLNSYDEIKLETMIRNATNEHLSFIKYLGAIIGTVGGLVIWNPIFLLILLVLAFLIYLTDLILVQR